jgi:hypothetical protein
VINIRYSWTICDRRKFVFVAESPQIMNKISWGAFLSASYTCISSGYSPFLYTIVLLFSYLNIYLCIYTYFNITVSLKPYT